MERDGSVPPNLINLGLSSETVSGLSEEAHPFPRPNLHERLDRALARTKPHWVVLGYGMNDGIYQPFSEERFTAFQTGLIDAVEKCTQAGARIILLTPAYFDRQTATKRGSVAHETDSDFAFNKAYPHYQEEVLSRYANWALTHDFGPSVKYRVDIQTALRTWVDGERKKDGNFTYGDGIHPTALGHLIIAKAILKQLGYQNEELTAFSPNLHTSQDTPTVWSEMTKRRNLLTFSWLTEVGHKRPKTPVGKPLPEARKQADEILRVATSLIASGD